MSFMGLSKSEQRKLETEVISNAARLKLTRLMRRAVESDDANVGLMNRNQFVNIGRTVLGLPIYRLEPDDGGLYLSEEFGWHMAELELVMRRPSTAQLVETLGDMIQMEMLRLDAVNEILADDNASVRFRSHGFHDNVSVEILTESEMDEEIDQDEHPNIRLLTSRMEAAFDAKDYAAVLHTSATIFETLAKLVFSNPAVEGQTLGGIFDGYRKRSGLPDAVLDFVLETYQRRNAEPLAGHGATRAPAITAKEAVILIEMTKMSVRLERRIALQELDAVPKIATRKSAEQPREPASMSGNAGLKKKGKKEDAAAVKQRKKLKLGKTKS
jgi:hypothetical protein